VHCTKAVYTVKSAPEDGRVCRPKHVEQIQIDQQKDINKGKLLHLVGCLQSMIGVASLESCVCELSDNRNALVL